MTPAADTNGRPVFRFGPFEVNARARIVSRNGRRLKLPGLPFEVLVALLEQRGEAVSRAALYKRLWPEGTFVDFDNNLNAAVARLRQTLGDSADRPRYIETVPRLGYRFVAESSALDATGVTESPRNLAEPTPGSARETSFTSAMTDTHPGLGDTSSTWRLATSRPAVWLGLIIVLALAGTVVGIADWPWSSRRESAAALERGRDLLARGDVRGATLELQRAIALDDRNALAHSTLAHALHKTSTQSLVQRPAGQSPALQEALRAVAIDPRCAPCQGTLGFFLSYHDWQWARAETHLVEAVRLDPGAAAIRPSFALLLVATGRTSEALAEIDRALDERPHELVWLVIRASIFYAARQYAEAVAAADRALSIDDKDRGAWEWRSRALFQMGRGTEGVQALSRAAFASQAPALERAVIEGGAAGGLRALLALTDDWQSRMEHSWRRAAWHMYLGQHDEALDDLERAFEQRNYNLMYVAVDPAYDPIQSHPRFQAILRSMGLGHVRAAAAR
jgi:DNA-binding winged helix-turn-helix (wHTH) protein/Tfp pilus assembly protein PilF